MHERSPTVSEHGRLGKRRRPRRAPPHRPDTGRRLWCLRPRGRATVVVAVLGLPLAFFYVTAQLLPGALWFHELGQFGVLRRIATAKAELWLLVMAVAAPFIALNLFVALSRTAAARSRVLVLVVVAVSLVAATTLATSAARRWQTFLLWRHRQPFGIKDPTSGKDVGFFVFSLPMQRLASAWLLTLVVVVIVAVALVYRAHGAIGLRPPRASSAAQAHLARLASLLLLVIAWRFRLERYVLELHQPSSGGKSFAGVDYVDDRVRLPGLTALSILSFVCALACLVAPRLARAPRRAALVVALPTAGSIVALLSVVSWLPELVQRFMVDPNPLLREKPFIERSIAATRGALGLDAIRLQPYAPAGPLTAADVSRAHAQLGNVQIWDARVLAARTRDLVAETPYFRPGAPTVDTATVGGRRRLTVASARELDLDGAGGERGSWSTDRLAYTHGLGLPRFSAGAVTPSGQPRLLDTGLGGGQPRIYFGDLPAASPGWVMVDTRRAEVDVPGATGYHYTGSAGIRLSSAIERAALALALRSKDLLISHDLTSRSRLLLHRDVRDRLATLAPFIRWDAHPAPVDAGGRTVFVVDGYTTSTSYPNAERVALGNRSVAYARDSVRATVDAFSGRVRLYLTGGADPIARAWSAAFPGLFRGPRSMPDWLREHARYPADLFAAQAAAYDRFHTTRPEVFASGSDVWSPPTSLSGSIDVAGDIQFDEDDEDDLRRPVKPGYKLAAPPGETSPRLMLSTSFSPHGGQNLVASLDGWIDDRGRAQLFSRVLARDPVTLGPAQISRLVFSTPRVSRLLGLRNRELRDLNRSSLDTVSLGTPHLLYLPGGIVQIQSLYAGASGPGVSRLIGVTAYVNGRAAVGTTIDDAVRQALHQPPRVDVLRPPGKAVVGTPLELGFRARNARREVVTIDSPAGRQTIRRAVQAGTDRVTWTPPAPGHVRVRVDVEGLDGTRQTTGTEFDVLSPAPVVRVTKAPRRVRVGQRVRLVFEVTGALSEQADVSSRDGAFTRRYLIRKGSGVVEWMPSTAGPATLRIRVRGREEQTAVASAKLVVTPGRGSTAPSVKLLEVPDGATVGARARIAFSADGARTVAVRVARPGGETRTWRFTRPAGRVAFGWTPSAPGDYELTITAHSSGGTATQTTVPLTAERRP